MTLGKQFEALSSEQQWPFVLKIKDKSKIEIRLDNDVTYISFGDESNEDGDGPEGYKFEDYVGDSDGVINLLRALGFNADVV